MSYRVRFSGFFAIACVVGAVPLPSCYAQVGPSSVYPGPTGQPIRPWTFKARHFTDQLLRLPVYKNIKQRLKRTQKRAGPAVSRVAVGEEHTFFTRDVLDMDQWHTVEATCVYSSDTVALWVETSSWQQLQQSIGTAVITDSLSGLVEHHTSRYSQQPDSGIIAIEQTLFGAPPDVDGDGILDILLLDIDDDFAQTGSYVAGFFDPLNLTEDPHSNGRDMLYLDIYPSLFYQDTLYIDRVAATIAHEYQHLIHANYEEGPPQYTFINEGLSELAEIVCGFTPRAPDDYLRDPVRPLLSWNYEDPLPDYGRASLFMDYLFQQIEYDKIHYLVQTQLRGMDAIEWLMSKYRYLSFDQLFLNWGKALLINDTSYDPAYGYQDQRKYLRFSSGRVYNHLPTVGRYTLPPSSHAPALFSLTSSLQFTTDETATGEPSSEITVNGFASYPKGYDYEIYERRPPMEAKHDPFGSIKVLLSNTTWQTQETDTSAASFRFLATGEKSGVTTTKAYDDGLADVFTGNASYLLLDGQEREAYALAFDASAREWIHEVSVKGIFQSELAGTSLSTDAERDLQVQLFGFDHGAPTKALTPAFTHTFERPMGDLQFETISLLEYYEQLSTLPDSFCVVIQNDGDDANYFAVGLDNSGPGHSWFSVDHTRNWHPMSERRVSGAMLKGWNVMIRAGLAGPEEERTAAIPYPSFDYDYRGVRLTMEPPFRVDTAQSSCFAELPDGQHVEGRPVYITGNNTRQLTYEFPVQLGGDYVFYNRAVAAGGRLVSRDEWEWEMPDAYGFELGANYPNPFQGSTTVPFELLEEARVGAEIFDLLGRKVLSISSQQFEAGLHAIPVTLQGVASGLYFVRMNMQRPENGHGTTKTTKMMLVR